MPRHPRNLIDGAMYHVFCRTARGLKAFAEPAEAERLLDLLHELKLRDGWSVHAWCIMPNHYHIALRTSGVLLSKSMHSIQGRFAQSYNRRNDSMGAFWQGRFGAQLVSKPGYMEQLLCYIHLNPVKAGLVDDPVDFRWSGHRELMRQTGEPLVDVDETLQFFGATLAESRRAYASRLHGARDERWTGLEVSKLPWWISSEDRSLDPKRPEAEVDAQGVSSAKERPELNCEDFLERVCAAVHVPGSLIAGPGRESALCELRTAIATVGVYFCCLKSKELGDLLGRHSDSVSRMAAMGLRRRIRDPGFRQLCELLEDASSGMAVSAGTIRWNEGDQADRSRAHDEDGSETSRKRSRWEVWD